jgi:hypothetical protein
LIDPAELGGVASVVGAEDPSVLAFGRPESFEDSLKGDGVGQPINDSTIDLPG